MSHYPDIDKLSIIHYPDPKLTQRASPIEKPDPFHRELAERMVELMVEGVGIGVAGNQVGWLERILVISPSGEPAKAEVYINPRIVQRAGEVIETEGCLSVPGVTAKVRRAERVTVAATRPDGNEVKIEAEGLLARLWQHEIDHLEGLLFVEKVGPGTRLMLRPGLRRLEKAYRDRQRT